MKKTKAELESENEELQEIVSALSQALDRAIQNYHSERDERIDLENKYYQAIERSPHKNERYEHEARSYYEAEFKKNPAILPGRAARQIIEKWHSENRKYIPSQRRVREWMKHANPTQMHSDEWYIADLNRMQAEMDNPLTNPHSTSDIIVNAVKYLRNNTKQS